MERTPYENKLVVVANDRFQRQIQHEQRVKTIICDQTTYTHTTFHRFR